EEPKVFSSLNGWPCKDDLFDLLILQRPNGYSNGRIGFTSSSRANSKYNIIFLRFLDQLLLVGRTGSDRFSIGPKDKHIVGISFCKVVNGLRIIAAKYLLKVILTHMAIPFQVR